MSKSAKRKARAKHRKQMTRATTATAVAAPRARQVVRAPAPPPRKKAVPPRAAEPTQPTTADAIQRALRPTGLPNVLAIARRDLTALFVSPIGWVVASVFTFIVSSFGFYFTVIAGRAASMDGVFGVITTLLVPVLIPLITMRLLAEERGQGTLELLLTSPVRDWELTLGKWLAGFAFYLMLLAVTLVYVALLRIYRSDLDFGLIAATYLGLVLVGAAAVAIGLLMSSLTRNQIIAFILGMAALYVIWFAGYIIGYFTAPPGDRLFLYVGGFNRYQSFTLGQAAARDVVYWASLLIFPLFLTERFLASRRWR